MIPALGPAIGAGIKTTMIAGQWLLGREGKQLDQSEALSTQYMETIGKIALRFAPLVMLIEDAHWIDDASCRLLFRLALKMQSQRLVIIVTYRPGSLIESHPLRKTRNELLIKNLVNVMTLGGLNKQDIETYVVRRFGNSLHTNLAAWLVWLCKGHPLFITQYLSLLEQDKIIHQINGQYIIEGTIKYVANQWQLDGLLTLTTMPNSIEALLEQRIERLIEEDQEMLQLGAVQGEYFMSVVLAGLLKKDEMDILRRLRKVVEQHHLISLYTGGDFEKLHSDVYVFENALLHQAFYYKLSPRERVLYHRSVAEQLEKMLQKQRQPSRKLILEIAHHYDLGENPEKAANFYQLAAQSLLRDGATVEATEIAKRALRNVQQVANIDHQHAEILELLLSATAWRNPSEESDELSLVALINEAEAYATRSEDKVLLARIKFQHAIHIAATSDLAQRLVLLRDALDLIRQADEPVGEFFILSDLGQQMRSVNFEAGFATQEEAYQLFKDRIVGSQVPLSPELQYQWYLIQTWFGIAKFDRGDYSSALQLLEISTMGLREDRLKDDLVVGLNYLAQVYMSLGLFERAEAALKEALDLVKKDESPHIWTGYNLSLLGKLYLEWEHPELAVAPMLKGWHIDQTVSIIDIRPLIKNYYAELLMCPNYLGYDLSEADRVLAANIEEAKTTGYLRSAITALSLRSLVALANNQIDTSIEYSNQAVAYLQNMGTLPALRTEEVLFNHYQVMKAAGREEERQLYLVQAHAVLQKKADSIREDDYRKSFLERVPLSRAILSAMQAII